MRRFQPGQHGTLNEIDWRVVQGIKHPDDRRLEVRAMEFRAVPMTLGFLFADFFCENEDVLYPPTSGFLGGELYINFIRGSVQVGWEAAAEKLSEQRKRAAA